MQDEKKLIVYSYFRSSTSWRVRIALNYKNIPHEFRFVHLVKGEQKSEEYKKINPNAVLSAFYLGCTCHNLIRWENFDRVSRYYRVSGINTSRPSSLS